MKKSPLVSTLLCACLAAFALVASAQGGASPVDITNNTFCTATGTVYFANCNDSPAGFSIPTFTPTTLWVNPGCEIASVTVGLSNCPDGAVAQCVPFNPPSPLPFGQWNFEVAGLAITQSCQVVQS